MLDDLHQLSARARRAIDHGQLAEAEELLLTAAAETHVAEHDYRDVVVPLAMLFERRGEMRSALSVRWYLATRDPSTWGACVALLPHVPPQDRGRTYAAMGKLAEAAREMEDAGKVAAAAIYREQASDWQGARALWSRLGGTVLTGSSANGGDAYDAALVQCNLARCARKCGDRAQAHDGVVRAVRLLEEAADHFESVGVRERAFDCFQVLIQLGREHESFEDVLEGFVNCVRILREDHLKTYALHYMDDAIAIARERRELAAAATLAREASQYARSVGMRAASTWYLTHEGELWRDAALRHVAEGDPPEIAENALLAAVVAFGEVGQFGRVGDLYTELGGLDLPEARRAHYARAKKRYDGVADLGRVKVVPPDPTTRESQAGEVWHADLLEWEQAGSASECCADVLLGPTEAEIIRRKALLGRLEGLALEAAAQYAPHTLVDREVKLADTLAHVQLYVVLSPLERLFKSTERAVRIAVLSAMQRLFFKRSFLTVRRGLDDPDVGVIDQAGRAMEALYFDHAFDPLSRVVRESPSPHVRASAIKALSRVDTTEAAEFLFGVLAHGPPQDRDAAIRCLKQARGASFRDVARAEIETANVSLQPVLKELLAAR